jgi:hypothetical protein
VRLELIRLRRKDRTSPGMNVILDLASDEFWPDRAHIEFTVTD